MKTRYSSFESNNSTDASQLYHKFETILSWDRSFEKIIINTREIWAHTCFNSLFFFRSIRNVSLGVSFTSQKNVNFDEKMKVMPFTSNAIAHAWILELFPEWSETLWPRSRTTNHFFFVCFHKKCSRLMIYIYLYKKDTILGEDWLDRRILLKIVYTLHTHTSKMIRCA